MQTRSLCSTYRHLDDDLSPQLSPPDNEIRSCENYTSVVISVNGLRRWMILAMWGRKVDAQKTHRCVFWGFSKQLNEIFKILGVIVFIVVGFDGGPNLIVTDEQDAGVRQ